MYHVEVATSCTDNLHKNMYVYIGDLLGQRLSKARYCDTRSFGGESEIVSCKPQPFYVANSCTYAPPLGRKFEFKRAYFLPYM